MFNKIYKEIDDFTANIKEVKGCDEMLAYMSSSPVANVKLLMFASQKFSVYIRIMLFFLISSTGLFAMSSMSSAGINPILLAIVLVLFVFMLIFIVGCKKYLIMSINNTKKARQSIKE